MFGQQDNQHHDTTVVGLISGEDETAYMAEVEKLSLWCSEKNLNLNIHKTKELIMDHKRSSAAHCQPWNKSPHHAASGRTKAILGDPSHPTHPLFDLFPSGRRFRPIKSRTSRLKNSLFPWAIRTANNHSLHLPERTINKPTSSCLPAP